MTMKEIKIIQFFESKDFTVYSLQFFNDFIIDKWNVTAVDNLTSEDKF